MEQINNIDDLKAAISHLSVAATEQQVALKQRFSGAKATFNTLLSILPLKRPANWRGWIRPALRIAPAILWRTAFRRSSFFIKMLTGLGGQLGAKLIS